MDIKKVLLVKSLGNYYQSQFASVTTTDASNRYPRGRDQNEYKFTIH